MPGGQPEGEGKCIRGGLMACEEDGEGFVSNLLVGHRAGLVFCCEQHAQQVISECSGGAAIADDAINEVVQIREGAAHCRYGPDWKFLKQRGARKQCEGKVVVEDLHGVDEGLDAGVDVGA